MTNAPAVQPLHKPDCATDRPQIEAQIAADLDLIIDNQSGWLCVGWIDGDPKTEALHEEWFYVPAQREKALSRTVELAEQGSNIYARQCLFQRIQELSKRGDAFTLAGDYAHALPSRLIWKDDCRADTPASQLVETSPGNYQARIMLDRLATAAERKHLMTAWRDASGGDTCSADAVHHIRLAGGRNTKPGKHNHLVHLAVDSQRVYSADKLLARCGPVRESTYTPDSFSSDDWRDLPDGAALWQSPRWQALSTRQRPQLKTLLIDRKPFALPNKRTGRSDDDSFSNQRAVFVANALEAYTPPPLTEIRAVAWYFRDYLGERKTDREYQVDIDRLLGQYLDRIYTSKQREYQPEPTKYLQRPRRCAAAPRVARGRAGKHSALVETVYQALVARQDAPIKMRELASDLGMDRRTLSRILDELEADGRIDERRQAGQHEGLRIVLSGVIYSEPASTELPIATAQTDETAANAIESTSTNQETLGVYVLSDTPPDHTLQGSADCPVPDDGFLAYVQALAAEAASQGWQLDDYATLGRVQLEAEAARLEAFLRCPPNWRMPGFDDAEQAETAQYSAPITETAAEVGTYTGQSKRSVDHAQRWDWSNEAIHPLWTLDTPPRVREVAPLPRSRGTVSASDRYRADVALMDEYRLAGEIKKHTATLKKHAGATWLDPVRRKLAIVQAELDERGRSAGKAGVESGGVVPAPSQARAAQPRPDPIHQVMFAI